ncbi:hypothetical protein ACFYOT_40045 [Saccharothrix saharensis]|uniref:hypothetical protein n=1 Tax=Saccharothrix saharensis TaxID=571190 RepID=UPI00367D2B43
MPLRLAYLGVTNAFALLRLLPISDRGKDTEILALRHQITVWGVRTLHWDAELRRSRTLDHQGMIMKCGVTTAVPDLRPTR